MRSIDDLARRAREVLADGGDGTLHISDADLTPHATFADLSLLSYDDGGRPGFLCTPDSAVSEVAAAGAAAVLCVPAPRLGPDAATLVLAGRLAVDGRDEVDGDEMLTVVLQLESVVVEQRSADGSGTLSTPVPLAQYLAVPPDDAENADALTATATQLVEHSNQAHGDELRRFVSGLRAIPEADVLAAELSALDAEAVELRWLDTFGAHTTRVRFARRAHCPVSLARALRATLTGVSD